MKKKCAGSVQIEYIVIAFFCALGFYFGLVGNSGQTPGPGEAPPLVQSLHDRQTSFIDSVLAP